MAVTVAPKAAVAIKVGFHFTEEWSEIVDRKLAELDAAGVAFWGYGGSACHPLRQVQPFARANPFIEVVMLYTGSRFQSDQGWSEAMSVDGGAWQPIPHGVQTSGKWALVLDQLEPVDGLIDLGDYEIGIGPSEHRAATAYLRGQSDKACLRFAPGTGASDIRRVVMRGRLTEPWAVFLATI